MEYIRSEEYYLTLQKEKRIKTSRRERERGREHGNMRREKVEILKKKMNVAKEEEAPKTKKSSLYGF